MDAYGMDMVDGEVRRGIIGFRFWLREGTWYGRGVPESPPPALSSALGNPLPAGSHTAWHRFSETSVGCQYAILG